MSLQGRRRKLSGVLVPALRFDRIPSEFTNRPLDALRVLLVIRLEALGHASNSVLEQPRTDRGFVRSNPKILATE